MHLRQSLPIFSIFLPLRVASYPAPVRVCKEEKWGVTEATKSGIGDYATAGVRSEPVSQGCA
jgi:hypothetical protein